MHEVLRDHRLPSTAKLVRVQLQTNRIGTAAEHARSLGMSPPTIRRAIRALAATDWAYETTGRDGRSPLIVPRLPFDAEQMVVQQLLRVRREVAFGGEWTMKSVLDATVDDRDFLDNARPDWLVPGDGSGRGELDRWYRSAKVAVEFHGMQHYRYEPRFHRGNEEFQRQVLRDNAKAGLLMRRKIAYVEIAAVDLDFDYIVDSVRDLLPIRPIRMDSVIVQTLKDMCHSYADTVRRHTRI